MIENKIVTPIEYLECKSISLFDNLKGKANTLLPNEISSVFIGLMFGDTSGISDDVKEDFNHLPLHTPHGNCTQKSSYGGRKNLRAHNCPLKFERSDLYEIDVPP